MALTPLSGSSAIASSQQVDSDIPNTQSDVLPSMPFVKDAALNRYAIDSTQYPQATKEMIGLMKGKRILVTYYRLLNREGSNNRTNIADLPTARSVLDSEYQKIINLEITLPKAFQFEANNDQANMSIKGQAMFYPNMNPSIGDMFITSVGDGRAGLCRISSVTPMSWSVNRVYMVNFFVQEFLDDSNITPLEGMVTITSYFSKENYLGGTAALLSEQSYLQLQKLKAVRTNLSRYYYQTFFDSNICSFVRPDGGYDPWLVQFMNSKISSDDVVYRAKNLMGINTKFYSQTLWARLEDRYNTSIAGISPFYVVGGYRENTMGSFVTELIGRSVVYPSFDSQAGTPYLYSAAFYGGQVSAMTPEERMVYTAITERVAGDLTGFITLYLDPVYTLSLADQFYKIPVYIHLIDMSLQSQYREIDAPSMNFASSGDGD